MAGVELVAMSEVPQPMPAAHRATINVGTRTSALGVTCRRRHCVLVRRQWEKVEEEVKAVWAGQNVNKK